MTNIQASSVSQGSNGVYSEKIQGASVMDSQENAVITAVINAYKSAGYEVMALNAGTVVIDIYNKKTTLAADRGRLIDDWLSDVVTGFIRLSAKTMVLIDQADHLNSWTLHGVMAAATKAGAKVILLTAPKTNLLGERKSRKALA